MRQRLGDDKPWPTIRLAWPLAMIATFVACAPGDGSHTSIAPSTECLASGQRIIEEGAQLPGLESLPGVIGLRITVWPPEGGHNDIQLVVREGRTYRADELGRPPAGSGRGVGAVATRSLFGGDAASFAGYRIATETYAITTQDGRFVALTARGEDTPVERSSLLIIEQATRLVVGRVDGNSDSTFEGLAWSPDGRFIAALANTTLPICGDDPQHAGSESPAQQNTVAGSGRLTLVIFDRSGMLVARHRLVEGGLFLAEIIWQE